MANITVSADVDTLLQKQNKGEMSDFLGSSAELLVELTSNSQGPACVVETTSGSRTGIKTKWTPTEDSDPDSLWDATNSTFTAPSDGLYAFHLDKIVVNVYGRAPLAAGYSGTSSATNSAPRGIGLLVNGVPYLLEDLTATSVSGDNARVNLGLFISNANNGYSSPATNSTSTLIMELTENDVVSLATVLKRGGLTGYHSSLYLHFSADRVHEGPSGRPIKIYKI